MNESRVARVALAVSVIVVVGVGSLVLFGPLGIVVALGVLAVIWIVGAMFRTTQGTPTT
jgi:hypothetical protein